MDFPVLRLWLVLGLLSCMASPLLVAEEVVGDNRGASECMVDLHGHATEVGVGV